MTRPTTRFLPSQAQLTTGAVACVLAAVAGGCGGSGGKSSACGVGGSGQLVLAVAGLPDGVTPMVRLTGGTLAAPMVISPGSPVTVDARGGYQLEWRRVKTAPDAGSIVGKAYSAMATSFDGCVKSGSKTTATLTFAQEPGSAKMWMTVSNPPTLGHVLAGFDGADLTATATKTASVWKSKNFTGHGEGGAFDSSGNLWIPGGDRVNAYGMPTLAMTSEAAPDVTLTQPASAAAKFAAFDADGNLWVSRGAPATDDSIVAYAPDALMADGAPTPTVVITSPDLMDPAGLAFDKAGNLWVASQGNDKVLMFTHDHLAATSAAAADVVLTAKTAPTVPVASTYTNPYGVAFDKTDTLWVGYVSNLVGFTPAQQATSALVVGPIALNIPPGTGAFAFDESGGLWIPGGSPATFQRVPAATLAAGGDVTPDIVIHSDELGYVESIVLDPAPTWSPIHDLF